MPGEVVRCEHFVLADLLKSIPGSSSKAGFAREPQTEIAEGALISFVRTDQSPLREQDSQPSPQVVKRKKAKKVGHIEVVSGGLKGIMDWVDPISSELAEGREDDMSNFAVGFSTWMHPQAKGSQ